MGCCFSTDAYFSKIYGCGIEEGRFCVIIEQDALNKSGLITQDFRVKHTNITTIYNEYENTDYLIKLFKMPSWEAWA